MSKKKSALPFRPEPPTIEQIISDIEASSANDVIYSTGKHCNKREGLMTESFTSVDDANSSISSSSPTASQDEDLVYQKALELIKLTKQLESAPDKLQTQSNNLQSLGCQLSETIDKLKHQSKSAIDSINQ